MFRDVPGIELQSVNAAKTDIVGLRLVVSLGSSGTTLFVCLVNSVLDMPL